MCRGAQKTPDDGAAVMKLESRISNYRADLSTLKRDLGNSIAAKELVRACCMSTA